MILLDADVIVIDQVRPTDTRRPVNRQALDALAQQPEPFGMMTQALLETVGILSYHTPVARISAIATRIVMYYGLRLVPDPVRFPDYAGCRVDAILTQIRTKMSLGDAVQAVQIESFARDATVLLTWNARHFAGKIVIPVQTPADWLVSRGGPP